MATSPNIVLPKPKVLIYSSQSTNSFETNGVALNFGTIQMIYETSDLYENGQSVLYNPKNSIPIKYGSDNFLLLNEEDLFFYEPPYIPSP